ncbi:hypothetical protein [Acrocarpospora sp. B8E8]|uniref:hypothetical protein n=1 Tax=Acrocarpospora sp. B8E8 TaxID=3153572 RepID=UPI00325DBECA
MYLLTVRAAVVVIAASVVAAITVALVLSTGSSWQLAVLTGASAFAFSVHFFNGIIPPGDEENSRSKSEPR